MSNDKPQLTDKERLAVRLTDYGVRRDEDGRRVVVHRPRLRRPSRLNDLRTRDSFHTPRDKELAEREKTREGDSPNQEELLRRSREVTKERGLNGLIERLGEMRRYKQGLLPEERRSQIEAELVNPLSESSVIRGLEDACAAATGRLRRDPDGFLAASISESLQREIRRREQQENQAHARDERDAERENDM